MFRSLFNSYSIDRKEHSIGRKSIESNFRPIENYETRFFVEFSGNYLERLKRFQALLLHKFLLMKHNHMSINRGLCGHSPREKHKKSYGHSPKLLSVEPNILVVSWGQICDNSLATKVWGANIV